MKKIIAAFSAMLTIVFVAVAGHCQTSTWVYLDTTGKLVCPPDAKGNKVPDFSGVGYMNGETPIPTIAVVKTVSPVPGDNLANIQTAIDQVAAMPLDNFGFRGAILFKKGKYLVSDTVKIKASGIVLRGEGQDSLTGTCFVATKKDQYVLFYFEGSSAIAISNSTKRNITDVYVPFGTKKINVSSVSGYKVGNSIVVHRVPNQAWIDLLTMAQWGWTAGAYDVYYERKVLAINGNTLTMDAPIMDAIDTNYSIGEVYKYTTNRINKCGIENMCLTSLYDSDTAENHGWEAVGFQNAEHCWARSLTAYYFGFSAVHVWDRSIWVTVQDCKMYDPKSVITGGRRYSFNVDGQRTLVQNCIARRGRHDYVNGSITPGPNVFYNSTATVQYADIGPHQRWSTGILFDNITSNASQNVQNRTNAGSGHGWAGAQTMFWNCMAGAMIVQDPEGDAVNWAIGCVAPGITNIGDWVTEPLGIVESKNKRIVSIPSLYIAQLNDRFPQSKRKTQTIAFDTLATATTATADFSPKATASSNLPVGCTSSNTAVATIVNGKIHIVGPGTSIITATQPGDTAFQPAPNYGQQLKVVSALDIEGLFLSAHKTPKGYRLTWNENGLLMGVESYVLESAYEGQVFVPSQVVGQINAQIRSFEIAEPALPTMYRLKAVAANGRTVYSNSILVKPNNAFSISITPNPAVGMLTIKGIFPDGRLQLLSGNGTRLRGWQTTATTMELSLEGLPSGPYRLLYLGKGQKQQCIPFIKK